jgi:hypothetical protein
MTMTVLTSPIPNFSCNYRRIAVKANAPYKLTVSYLRVRFLVGAGGSATGAGLLIEGKRAVTSVKKSFSSLFEDWQVTLVGL